MLIYREETFGPVAAVVPFDDEDDVIAMANDTDYGLAAYIYTKIWRAHAAPAATGWHHRH